MCTRFFFFNDTATTEIYTLSLHDALPISRGGESAARLPGLRRDRGGGTAGPGAAGGVAPIRARVQARARDRPQTEADGSVGRQPARAAPLEGARLDRGRDGLPVPAVIGAGLAAVRAAVQGRRPIPVSAALADRAGRPGQDHW